MRRAIALYPLETRLPPPLLVVMLGVASWLFARYAAAGAGAVPHGRSVGIVVIAAGLFCNLAPKRAFRRAGTTVNPLRPQATTQLVQCGLHRMSRNPMYLGHALILAGWALHLQWWPALLAVPVYVVYITHFQILPEERALAARFGAEYAAYCARVRRWF